MGEHDIDYRPRINIKAHTLADTLRKIPKAASTYLLEAEASKDGWELHIDGVGSKEWLGAGLILKNPKGDEITYALRFDFQVSNNEAEYEALLAGLRLAQEVGAKHLRAFSDSLLVTSQVNNTYETKDQRMQKYLEITQKLAHSFKSFKIRQIPRGKIQELMLSAS